MSCLLGIYLQKKIQCIFIGQLEMKIRVSMYFQLDTNFYIFATKFKGLTICGYSDLNFDLRSVQH